MTVRINHEYPDTPEEVKFGSIERLTDFLLRPIDGDPQLIPTVLSPIGYVPESEVISFDSIVDLRPLRQRISDLENELLEIQRFHTPVRLFQGYRLKKQIAELRETDYIPASALPLYVAGYEPPYTYGDLGYGPQISDSQSASLSLLIRREGVAYKDEEDRLTGIDGSFVTQYWSHETYQDEDKDIKNTFIHEILSSDELGTANNPELLSVLKYFAGARTKWDEEPNS